MGFFVACLVVFCWFSVGFLLVSISLFVFCGLAFFLFLFEGGGSCFVLLAFLLFFVWLCCVVFLFCFVYC